MGMDDVFSTESALVAAVTATVLSPKTRETVRKGAVYGLAGALKVGDVVAGAARGAVRGVRGDETAASQTAAAAASKTAPATPVTNAAAANRSRSTGRSAAATRRAATTAKSGGNAARS